ncbi:hypothetical protein NQZ68_004462 [Dissostichus eleginoides]|nr:hypothetical protein NQZ68_004462 [Dissostichus eleginoides]
MVQHWTDSFTDNVTESVQSWIYKPGISRRALLLPTVGFSAHPIMRADCAKEGTTKVELVGNGSISDPDGSGGNFRPLLRTVFIAAEPCILQWLSGVLHSAHHSGRIHHEYFSSPTAKGNILDCFKKKLDYLVIQLHHNGNSIKRWSGVSSNYTSLPIPLAC